MLPERLQNHRLNNLLHTLMLLAGLVGLLCLLGWSLAGVYGIVFGLFIGIIPLVASIRLFPAITLKMFNARPLDQCEAPKLHAIVRELSSRAMLREVPSLHYIASKAIFVFSIGHGPTAVISVSDGVLRLLTLRELAAVIAHEICHIRNNDTWVMSFADVVSRVTHTMSIFGQILVIINLPLIIIGGYSLPWFPLLLMLFAPAVSGLLQLALSRTREYNADFHAAHLTGDAAGLASALAKMEEFQQDILQRSIIGRRKAAEPSLLRTHPSTGERLRRLRIIGDNLAFSRLHLNHADNHSEELPSTLGTVQRKPRHRLLTGLWH